MCHILSKVHHSDEPVLLRGLWARNWKFSLCWFWLINQATILHVMTAELLWHVWNCDLFWWLYSMLLLFMINDINGCAIFHFIAFRFYQEYLFTVKNHCCCLCTAVISYVSLYKQKYYDSLDYLRFVIRSWLALKLQCLKLMVAQSPLATKNWAGPVKFDPGQVKYNSLYKEGNILNISGRLRQNFSLKHWNWLVCCQFHPFWMVLFAVIIWGLRCVIVCASYHI